MKIKKCDIFISDKNFGRYKISFLQYVLSVIYRRINNKTHKMHFKHCVIAF